MLLQPKKTKYKKYFKPRKLPLNLSKNQRLYEKNYFVLIATEPGFLNGKQIESARQNIRRKVKREGRLEIPILPDIPITRKASAARMGKGKGKINHWEVSISPGKAIFRLYGVDSEQGMPALKSGSKKLPIKVKIHTI